MTMFLASVSPYAVSIAGEFLFGSAANVVSIPPTFVGSGSFIGGNSSLVSVEFDGAQYLSAGGNSASIALTFSGQ